MPSVPRGGPRPPPYVPPHLLNSMDTQLTGLRPSNSPKMVTVDFLMPNSIIITHQVDVNARLMEIKVELWDKASEYPLFGILHDAASYHFACLGQHAETLELMDETKCYQEINPFNHILKVIERKGHETERHLNSQIGLLIGKGLHEFDALKNPEVNEFRWRMKLLVDEEVAQRNKLSWEKQVQYQYPSRIAKSPELPNFLHDRLFEDTLYISVQFDTVLKVQSTFTFRVSTQQKPEEFLDMVLTKKFNTFEADKQNRGKEDPKDYKLKAPGHEEYLIGDVPLSQFMYIREHIAQEELQPIHLVIVHKHTIQVPTDNIYESIEDISIKSMRNSFSSLLRKNPHFISSWSIKEAFSFKVGSLSKLYVESEDQVEVQIESGLYHGGELLCSETQMTREVGIMDGQAVIEQDLNFDILVCDIPRNARLCLVIYEVPKNAKAVKGKTTNVGSRQGKRENRIPIAWVNTTVFDYKNQLKGGSMSLYSWNVYEDQNGEVDLPNALGTVVSNPDHDRAVTLTISFTKYHPSSAILYPSRDEIVSRAQENPLPEEPQFSASIEEVRLIADRDPLTEIHEQEKKSLWALRRYCQKNLPHVLPKLLQCVEWNNHLQVAEMLWLLSEWPQLTPESALELLDYAYAEPVVRSYAIQCLNDLSDDDLLLYLLQLVQALKHENYLKCELVEFLLMRALKNMRIGHYLFWHLRSEMHVPSVSIRFGLLLESYCRGSLEHMKQLIRQLESLKKFKDLKKGIQDLRYNRERALFMMQECMTHGPVQQVLSDFLNPLDPMYRIKRVRHEKCKIKDSKMVPLWLVFENKDAANADIYLIFKSGDDLRQDMLTLQMIRIMDKLWKDHGLDLRMNPYGCMSTDDREGLIQVVLNAETIANIQREKGIFSATCAFRKGSLLDWLRDHNNGDVALNKAIHEFTLSCAGYCVATYVLGIADRHSDNIMIMKTGQLFHIDFGHILGHFKEKFGIKRERQPFVLTHDFIHIITKGRQTRSEEFIRFKDYCERAFLILRHYGSFIISLFAMMISTGLPELQSEQDLDYLRETLKLDLTEDAALEHFRCKFAEALSNSWKTSINWAFHAMARSTK
ncbi:phosphatidylinositol 4,5-bisphosphate 3-kinase catalytic subunit delta isoform-like [Oratosquilla oratoria]|uniref:phosphatidylinositol 4,5-bisphosphate 3-kinase catalytic subunit delta isoform-like n=1 Tax=Oratosquilla oratoria TaxID=337810 RepID=UPI003F76AAD3